MCRWAKAPAAGETSYSSILISCIYEIGLGRGPAHQKQGNSGDFCQEGSDREESSGERSNPIPSNFTVTLGKRALAYMHFDCIKVLCMPRMPEHMRCLAPAAPRRTCQQSHTTGQ